MIMINQAEFYKNNDNLKRAAVFRLRDGLLLFGIVVLALLLFLISGLFSVDGETVVISVDGVQNAEYPLSENRRIELSGNMILIENQMVIMEKASCPDKICVDHMAISKSGQSIVCLPNRVVVEIKGARNAVDGETL